MATPKKPKVVRRKLRNFQGAQRPTGAQAAEEHVTERPKPRAVKRPNPPATGFRRMNAGASPVGHGRTQARPRQGAKAPAAPRPRQGVTSPSGSPTGIAPTRLPPVRTTTARPRQGATAPTGVTAGIAPTRLPPVKAKAPSQGTTAPTGSPTGIPKTIAGRTKTTRRRSAGG